MKVRFGNIKTKLEDIFEVVMVGCLEEVNEDFECELFRIVRNKGVIGNDELIGGWFRKHMNTKSLLIFDLLFDESFCIQ